MAEKDLSTINLTHKMESNFVESTESIESKVKNCQQLNESSDDTDETTKSHFIGQSRIFRKDFSGKIRWYDPIAND
jgi:hypothetical protein